MKKLDIKISGMSCVNCALNIEKSINSLEGIVSCNVNFSTEKGHFEYNDLISELMIKDHIRSLGYEIIEENANENRLFLNFLFSFLLSIFIFVLEMGPLMNWPSKKINWYIQLICSLPIYLHFGLHFQKALLTFLKSGQSNMNTLIGMGTSAAFIYSLFVTLFPEFSNLSGLSPKVYYEAIGFIVSFVQLGQWLEKKAKRKARESIESLFKQSAKFATVVKNGQEFEVPIEHLKINDLIRVRPGGRIPVDGLVTKGTSSIDESMISGEPIPLLKNIGDKVFAATINLESVLEINAIKVGKDTFLSHIIDFVNQAQNSKPQIQRYADKISAIFVPLVILLSLITFFGWFLLGPDPKWGLSISNLISVLVIACPCALGLATPTAVLVSTNKASQMGILISGGEIIENANKINAVIFDKTGTLTEGRPTIERFVYFKKVNEELFWKEIASIESLSEHPLSKAIVNYAKEKNINLEEPNHLENFPGRGIKASISNKEFILGNRVFLRSEGISINEDNNPGTHVYVAINGELIAQIFLMDKIKPRAKELITRLEQKGISSYLISGDNQAVTQKIAQELGIKHFEGNCDPLRKAKLVQDLQEEGKKVAMLGDGINDAPALARANLSMAMGTGTDLAINTADVTLIGGDLSKVLEFFNLSDFTLKIIKQNLFLSSIYNAICLPLATGVFYNFLGWTFPPELASLAMGLSSISVMLNSFRIKKRIL